MVMPARPLFRCAAGKENRSSLMLWQTGQFPFFEGRGRDSRDIAPMLHVFRSGAPTLAKSAIGLVVSMLELKQIERKVVEFRLQPSGKELITFFHAGKAVENAVAQA